MASLQRIVAACVACVVPTAAVFAQAYPSKPIRIIVPYPVGGAVDVTTRLVAHHMAQTLGQPIVVDNRPGANANLGPEAAAHAAPDGYTLLSTATYLLVNPLIETNLRWKPSDFTPVARFTVAPNVLVVPASAPVSSLKEFLAAAKAQPGMIYGDTGPGAPQTMAIEMLKAVTGIPMQGVTYKGGPPIVADLMNSTISMSVLPLNVGMGAISGGRLKVLASTSNKRSPLLPDTPTMAESGYPQATVVSWYGFHAPAGTPPEIVRKLSAAVKSATGSSEVKTRTAGVGGEVAFMDTATFDAFLREDAARWEQFVQSIRKLNK